MSRRQHESGEGPVGAVQSGCLADGIRPFQVMEILARARQLEASGRSVVHLEIGEPDFPTPEPVTAAAIRFLADGQVRYTPAAGLPELRERIARFYRDRYGVTVAPQRIFLTPGASGAFSLVLAAVLSPGRRVMLADPGYPCYSNFVRLYSGDPHAVPVGPEQDFHLNAALCRAHGGGEVPLAISASPSNPTGTVMNAAVLRELVEWFEAEGGVFISDEIYHGLEYGRRSASALEFGGNAFVVNSFSKYFGMTGWRLGWLIVPEAYTAAVERVAQNIFISAPTLSQHAALAAFSDQSFAELERRRRAFEVRRDFLWEALVKLGFRVPVQPAGAFYIYADCSALTEDSAELAAALLEHEGVAVTPGKDFGVQAPERYLRFAYTADVPVLREAVERMRRFVGG
ncbi:aminotransferase class I/II-fold pyridoxal phosphate-dependent enzyme [Methylococcus geothermalis]|uniref:Aminotransferase n=1 Tax=Methylococcus geothermalis TaxID=2681310 RepID=A0A858Q7C7_9GAMM|nr:aminotransferase class I/II-fold pyridoxal phosphate-dependent enzyme [Methylococcus geothermalis]QJD29717.1 aminotransferase class I/II-fold pyridoxal phosphate-dependent enzyme [Methylococcus geothermalis]